jgi:predicted phosphodiesterase
MLDLNKENCLNLDSARRMKIQYASDLHLEFKPSNISNETYFSKVLVCDPSADILILAGDIGYPEEPITFTFLKWCCRQWKRVVWIFGNHEYYNPKQSSDPLTTVEKEQFAKLLAKSLPNLHILLDSALYLEEFPDVVILGSTLWTDLQDSEHELVETNMYDCKSILGPGNQLWSGRVWHLTHEFCVAMLMEQLDLIQEQGKKAIVVTHHLPTYDMILDCYKDSPINCGFAAHADDILQHPAVASWICGHSHGQRVLDISKKDGTTIQCRLNARGYPHESSEFTYKPCVTFEVKTT